MFTISLHHWAGLCQPHNQTAFAPTRCTFTSALPAFSEASPWQPQVTHIELILNRLGGIVRSHAGTQTSVWRWFCNKTSPLIHTQRRAKSSPQAEICEVTIWRWITTDWHWLNIKRSRKWEIQNIHFINVYSTYSNYYSSAQPQRRAFPSNWWSNKMAFMLRLGL